MVDLHCNNRDIFSTLLWAHIRVNRICSDEITDMYFFHTQLWFPAFGRNFRLFESDFRCFCEFITGKNAVEEIESIMGARVGTEFTLVSLYSTEITRHHSWFLEYKITRVNSPPHGRPWCILYITVCSYRARQAGRISQSHPPPAFLATCFGTRMYNSKKENIYNAVPQARYRAQAACPIRVYMIKFRFQTLVIDNWAGDNSRHHLYTEPCQRACGLSLGLHEMHRSPLGCWVLWSLW